MTNRSIALLISALLAAASCGRSETQEPRARAEAPRVADSRGACAQLSDHAHLKALAFRHAAELRPASAAQLDRIAAGATVRIEDAAETSRDDALNVTVCKGRMVIELPHGAADAFNGERRLTAPIAYAVQAAADGSRRIYQREGGEPIAFRLAAIGLAHGAQTAERAPKAEPARPVPAARAPAARPSPAPVVLAQVEERPTRSRGWSGREPRLTSRGRPSFDCRRAQSRPDRMVCADERLAALDRVTVSFYRAALANTDRATRAILRDTAQDFTARRARCRHPGCLARAYQDRMNELDRIATLD